ncbi:MAG TPA: adenylyl-sulfate kinase [Planctomycetaceae bacterium]|nr:adenylyl-sulfate kinase [Planctomycetaceae bacterium]
MSNPNNLSDNIVWHATTIQRRDRESRLGQKGTVIWLTGLSGCGKSTIANELESLLYQRGAATVLLDGDNVRHGLCAPPQTLAQRHGQAFADRFGLGFGQQDREENIRRIAAVGELFVSSGMIAITAFVSPYRNDRQSARKQIESAGAQGDFVEVFVDTPLEICERRDPKGLYKKARAGEIKNFTGISDPYQPPSSPEIHLIGGDDRTVTEQANEIIVYLEASGRLRAN